MSLIKKIHDTLRDKRITHKEAAPDVAGKIARGRHKEYPRMPIIPLEKTVPINANLAETIEKRRSYWHFHPREPLSNSEVSSLLGSALGAQTDERRRYPSGGALFPIETYLCGPVLQGHPNAVFHYHPTNHALEHLWDAETVFTDFVSEVTPKGSSLIVFTAVWERTSIQYGNLGYSHALIEAGHMAQNILLIATALNIATRPIAGFNDEKLSELLDLDTEHEQVVYVIGLAGRLTPNPS